MRKINLHIVLPIVLILNLLFSQVAINLFHNNHESRKQTVELSKGQSSVHKQIERCKICALDIAFHLFYSLSTQSSVESPAHTFLASPAVGVLTIFISFAQGRAPPVLIS